MDKADINKHIKKEARAVQRRVVGFLIYYFFLIFLGIALLAGVVFGTIKVLPLLLALLCIRFQLFILGAGIVFVVWIFVIRVGLFLIRPLFLSPKRDDSHRIEITSDEVPALFDIIADIAKETGNKMPKHVFLVAEVNACVFYDKTTVWSIFFPPRKNLDIGIGLLHGMNVDEFKAILAHEFGHFSQKSMRVRTMSYRLLLIVNDMMKNTRDLLADDTGASTLRFITESIVNRYNIVEKRNRSLSRYMEFEADGVACQLVSSKALISALCKLLPIKARHNLYSQMLAQALSESYFMQHYFRGYLLAYHYSYEEVAVESDTILSQPIGDEALYPSRIIILNGWNTHPSLQERIDNALRYADNDKEICLTAAETLIPEDLIDHVGRLYERHIAMSVLDRTAESSGSEGFSDLDDTFEQWITQPPSEHRMPHFLYPFIAHNVNVFPLSVEEEEKAKEDVPYPFTQENRDILIEYQRASKDWDTLNKIASGEYDVEEMLYNNEYYTSAYKPLEIHKEYMERLTAAVREVDVQVYKYLWKRADDKVFLNATYVLMELSTDALQSASDIYQRAGDMVHGLEYYRSRGSDVQVDENALWDLSYDTRKFIKKLDHVIIHNLCGTWTTEKGETIDQQLTEWYNFAMQKEPPSGKVFNVIADIWQLLLRMHNVSNDGWRNQILSAYREHLSKEK